MRKTIFAGLTVLDPGEPLSTDGFSFTSRNPEVTDRFLEVGARTHRHDAHARLADPVEAPGASAVASGGEIPADYTLYVGYTLLDADGRGETTLSEQAIITTREQIEDPTDAPEAVYSSGAGNLPAALYYYAMTFTDDIGGETTIGPYVDIERTFGFASGEITASGMGAIASAASAAGWRLYRSKNGAEYQYLGSGGLADNDFVDDGSFDVQATSPPDENSTNNNNALLVVVPSGEIGTASGFRLYSSDDGTFASPAVIGDYPSASAGTVITILADVVDEGAPPDVSTCTAGAGKIDPDTEILDNHWKRPVPTVVDLPLDAEEGDVRIVLDDGSWWNFIAGAWGQFAGGGGGGDPVLRVQTSSGDVSPDDVITTSAYADSNYWAGTVNWPDLMFVRVHGSMELAAPSGAIWLALYIDGDQALNEEGDPLELQITASAASRYALATTGGITAILDLGPDHPPHVLGPGLSLLLPEWVGEVSHKFEWRVRTDTGAEEAHITQYVFAIEQQITNNTTVPP